MSFIFFSFLFAIGSLLENKILYKFLFFLCLLYYSATYGYSYDWINYYDTYSLSSQGLTNYNFLFDEPGFFYLSEIFSKMGFSFPLFLSIITVFNYFCLNYFIRQTNNKVFSLLIMFSLYGYYLYAGGYRQSIAVSFDILAITNLFYFNSKKKFIIFSCIGVLFHYSSIVIFAYLILKRINPYNYKKFIFWQLISLIISFFVLNNYSLLSSVPYIGTKLDAYMLQFQDSGASFSGYLLGAKSILLYVVLFVFSMYLSAKDKRAYLIPVSIMFLAIFRSNPIMLRFSYYFLPLVVISMHEKFFLKKSFIKNELSKFIYIFSFLLISTMFYWTDAYKFASNSFGYVTDSPKEINSAISEKCFLLSRYMSDQVVIYRCR